MKRKRVPASPKEPELPKSQELAESDMESILEDSQESEDADEEIIEELTYAPSSQFPAVQEQPGLPAIQDPHHELVPLDSGASGVSRSRADPLRRYLEEITRHPLLTPEEEYALAQKLRNEGDLQAAKTLVSANLRLVVKIAFEYRSFYTNVLDLIQEGNIGLMKAVSKFDPNKGARLGYYSSWWIRSYILKYLLDNFRLVKVGTTQAQKKLFYHLMREKERLEAQGLLAGPKLLAEKLQVREKDVIEMEQRLSGRGAEMSLDTPLSVDSEGKATFLDQLAGDEEAADSRLAREELLNILREKLPEFQKKLNAKELSLLQDRILAESPKTLQEVADLYGLTRERARQIEAKIIGKLRDFLKEFI